MDTDWQSGQFSSTATLGVRTALTSQLKLQMLLRLSRSRVWCNRDTMLVDALFLKATRLNTMFRHIMLIQAYALHVMFLDGLLLNTSVLTRPLLQPDHPP